MTTGTPPIEMRTMDEADLACGLGLSRAAGWNQAGSDWRLLLSLGPGMFCVALEDGRAVACGGAVLYGRALAWVCMILVEPAARGRGLGTAVFEAVLARLDAAEPPLRSIGLDATPAGRGLYLRHGFEDAAGLVRLRLEAAPAAPAPPEDVHPLAASELEAVLAADRTVFGADRGSALRFAFETAPELAWVSGRGGSIAYCLGRHGEIADHLGPVVADEPGQGRDLVAACLSRARRRPLFLDACEGTEWRAALAAMGFQEQRPLTRMYRGGVAPPGVAGRALAAFGPELG